MKAITEIEVPVPINEETIKCEAPLKFAAINATGKVFATFSLVDAATFYVRERLMTGAYVINIETGKRVE